MSKKPEWEEAPEWANDLLVQPGFNGPCYCWAEAYTDGAKAQWHEDLGRDHMAFELRASCWDFVESRS